jgi:DNA-binding beta-propeller fold protein YncE
MRRALVPLIVLSLACAYDARAQPPPLDVARVAASGSMPKGATLSPDGTRFYVTNFGMENGDNVAIFDAATLERTGTIDLPGIAVESVVSRDWATL